MHAGRGALAFNGAEAHQANGLQGASPTLWELSCGPAARECSCEERTNAVLV